MQSSQESSSTLREASYLQVRRLERSGFASWTTCTFQKTAPFFILCPRSLALKYKQAFLCVWWLWGGGGDGEDGDSGDGGGCDVLVGMVMLVKLVMEMMVEVKMVLLGMVQ